MIVNWTIAALDDLRSIQAYIGRHSKTYANGMVNRIFAKTGLLIEQPYLGAVVAEYGDESLREVSEHPYRIVYRIVDVSRLDIVTIVHGARRLPVGL